MTQHITHRRNIIKQHMHIHMQYCFMGLTVILNMCIILTIRVYVVVKEIKQNEVVGEYYAICHSRELVGLRPSSCIFSPNSLFNFMDFKSISFHYFPSVRRCLMIKWHQLKRRRCLFKLTKTKYALHKHLQSTY